MREPLAAAAINFSFEIRSFLLPYQVFFVFFFANSTLQGEIIDKYRYQLLPSSFTIDFHIKVLKIHKKS